MGVSLNGGTPVSSILIGFSFINHPLWGIPLCIEPCQIGYNGSFFIQMPQDAKLDPLEFSTPPTITAK